MLAAFLNSYQMDNEPTAPHLQELVGLAISIAFQGINIQHEDSLADHDLLIRGLFALCLDPATCLSDVTPEDVEFTRQLFASGVLDDPRERNEALLVSQIVVDRRLDPVAFNGKRFAELRSLHPNFTDLVDRGDHSYLWVRNAVGVLCIALQASFDPDDVILTAAAAC